ncbi:hypothetical protein ACIXFK_15290 [Bacteroides fragilis]
MIINISFNFNNYGKKNDKFKSPNELLKELSGQVFALVRELPKPLSREEMRELKRLCRFLNNTVKDQERKQEVRK